MNSLNLYDFLFLALIIVGISTSKKGLPIELLPFGRWFFIVVLGAFVHAPLAGFIVRIAKISFGVAAVWAYLILAGVVIMIFIGLKTAVQRTIETYRFFGKADHVLGMAAGGLKMLCVAIAVMALLNSRNVSESKMAANAKMQEKNFGTINFPTLDKINKGVIHDSFFGGVVTQYTLFLLIQSRKDAKAKSTNADALDEVLGN